MIAPAGLLDTNTVILLDRIPADHLPRRSFASVVTLAELAVGPLVANEPKTRALRQRHLDVLRRDFQPIVFDVAAALQFGRVAASLREAGRTSASRSLDAMIAAVALAHDLPLYTCDPADFDGIEGLDVVAVPHPDVTAN